MKLETRVEKIETTVGEIKEMVKPVCEDYTFRRKLAEQRMKSAKRAGAYLGVFSAGVGAVAAGYKLFEMLIN